MDSLLKSARVLDLTDEKGLYCGRILGDLGADVLAVEPPQGSSARRLGPFYKGIVHPEKSLYWFYCSLNKRGVTLNIESREGAEMLKKLVRNADFFIESFSPGYLDSLHLGYANLIEINPRLIMTSITSFGQDGPYRDYKTTDLVLQSIGGMAYMHGDRDRAPLRMGGEPQAFILSGVQAAIGTMMAHYYRVRTGKGQFVDVSAQEAVELATLISPEAFEALGFDSSRGGPGRMAYRVGKEPLLQRVVYRCLDGYCHFFLGGGAQTGKAKSSRALVELANEHGMLAELKDFDWRRYDASKISGEDQKHLEDQLESFMMTMGREELLAESTKRGIMLAPIYTPDEFMEREQQQVREFWVKVDHPELGETITYAGAPVKTTACPWKVYRRAPLIGEHNREVYGSELGYSDTELAMLRQEGVV